MNVTSCMIHIFVAKKNKGYDKLELFRLKRLTKGDHYYLLKSFAPGEGLPPGLLLLFVCLLETGSLGSGHREVKVLGVKFRALASGFKHFLKGSCKALTLYGSFLNSLYFFNNI